MYARVQCCWVFGAYVTTIPLHKLFTTNISSIVTDGTITVLFHGILWWCQCNFSNNVFDVFNEHNWDSHGSIYAYLDTRHLWEYKLYFIRYSVCVLFLFFQPAVYKTSQQLRLINRQAARPPVFTTHTSGTQKGQRAHSGGGESRGVATTSVFPRLSHSG